MGKYVIVSSRSAELKNNEYMVNAFVLNGDDQHRHIGMYEKAMRFDSIKEAEKHLPISGFQIHEDLGDGLTKLI